MIGISVAAAAVAGIVSFLSPRVLPLVPGYLSYLSGRDSGAITTPPRSPAARCSSSSACSYSPGGCTPLLVAGCDGTTPRSGAPASTARTAPVVAVADSTTAEHDSLPHLSLPDLAGRRAPLRARADEVTVINFWATWCVPCLHEIPELVALSEQWKSQNIRVVGIAIDSGDPADVAAFASAHGMRYALLAGQQRWARRYFAVIGLPVTLVADRSGVIRRRLIGPQTRAQFETAVRDALVHRGTTATP